jgi:phosphoglycerol transferase
MHFFLRVQQFFLIFLIIAIANGTFWMTKEFGEVYPFEFFYHLFYGIGDIGTINHGHALSLLFHLIISPFIASSCILLCLYLISYARIKTPWVFWLASKTTQIFTTKYLLSTFALTIIFLLYSINIHYLFGTSSADDFFKENYIQPSYEKIEAPSIKRNLILIYVESLSAEYEDIERYPQDLLKNLKELTKNDFRLDFKQAFTNRWTQAGLFDSMCGLPLKISFGRRFRDNPRLKRWNEKATQFFNNQNTHSDFAPNITCLGSVLQHFGYTNIFMGGADLEFSGKGQFLNQHGYQETYGKKYWESIGENSFNQWGLNDDRLFFHAKNKILALNRQDKPFNFTMLTLSLHEPSGFYDQACKQKNYFTYEGLIQCSDETLSEFVNFFHENNLSKTTDLVIIGDHNPRKNISLVDDGPTNQSKIFNRFITTQPLKINRNATYHFGIFPSILNMLGFSFPQNKLGLENSFFGELNNDDLHISSLKPSELNDLINSYSLYYSKMMYGKK